MAYDYDYDYYYGIRAQLQLSRNTKKAKPPHCTLAGADNALKKQTAVHTNINGI